MNEVFVLRVKYFIIVITTSQGKGVHPKRATSTVCRRRRNGLLLFLEWAKDNFH
jgi:hypothetical protein